MSLSVSVISVLESRHYVKLKNMYTKAVLIKDKNLDILAMYLTWLDDTIDNNYINCQGITLYNIYFMQAV